MSRLLAVFLVMTFGITWVCWWLLAVLAGAGTLRFGQPVFMLLYDSGVKLLVGLVLVVAFDRLRVGKEAV